jgi:hypothetical protein
MAIKAVQLIAAAITPQEQEAVDTWIEVADMDEAVMKQFLLKGPVLSSTRLWRAEFGSRIQKFRNMPVGELVDMSWKSTSMSMAALKEGVIEPNGGAYWLLELRIPSSGLKCGRALKHSDRDHPENVQQEFLIGPNVKFKVMTQANNRTVLVAQNSMH